MPEDRQYSCIECGATFALTASEIEFYQRKGLDEPKRCVPCRRAKRARFQDRDGPRDYAGAPGRQPGQYTEPGRDFGRSAPRDGRGGRPFGAGPGMRQRGAKFFVAHCSLCGAPARVPFEPDGVRPIYCRACFVGGSPTGRMWGEGPKRRTPAGRGGEG